jgi:hypothetical protein
LCRILGTCRLPFGMGIPHLRQCIFSGRGVRGGRDGGPAGARTPAPKVRDVTPVPGAAGEERRSLRHERRARAPQRPAPAPGRDKTRSPAPRRGTASQRPAARRPCPCPEEAAQGVRLCFHRAEGTHDLRIDGIAGPQLRAKPLHGVQLLVSEFPCWGRTEEP